MLQFSIKNIFGKSGKKSEVEQKIENDFEKNDDKPSAVKGTGWSNYSNNKKSKEKTQSKTNEKLHEKVRQQRIENAKYRSQYTYVPESIYGLKNLSERTYNALLKNGIAKLEDLNKYGYDIRQLKQLPGLGMNAIVEIDEALKEYEGYRNFSIENCSFCLKKDNESDNNIEADYVGVRKLDPFYAVNGIKYHIDYPAQIAFSDKRLKNFLIKNNFTFRDLFFDCDRMLKMKGVGRSLVKLMLSWRYNIYKYYGIDNPLNVEFLENNDIDFLSSIRCFYENLTDLEKELIRARLRWFKNEGGKITLEELGGLATCTRERVRQVQEMLIKNYVLYLTSISRLLENSVIKDLGLTNDFVYFNYDNIIYSSSLGNAFLADTFKVIFKNTYGIWVKNGFYFFYSLSDKNPNEIRIVLDYLDKCYENKKIRAFVFTLNDIQNKIKINCHNYSDLIEYYIFHKYGIKKIDNSYTFPENKRDYNTFVMDELRKLDEPIHFSELYETIREKYPDFKWKEASIHSTLVGDEDALNVGSGLYIHSSKRPWLKGLKSSEDVVVKFLSEKENHRATYQEIFAFVRKYLEVDPGSIEAAIKLNKYGNFDLINNREVGLKGKWF